MSTELAPCIAVIGPANSGKTSLLDLLDEALQQDDAAPLVYVVKANPDGSARYAHNTPDMRNREKGQWTPETIGTSIGWIRSARKHLEIVLVDVGGNRKGAALEGNLRLFRECTHYLVLARHFTDPAEEREKGMEAWAADAEQAGLKPFARIVSTIKVGDPSFDPASRTGLFRGDAGHPRDTLNIPLVDALTASLMSDLRLQRDSPQYFDLRRRHFWRETDLPALGGKLGALQDALGVADDILLGGSAPIFAYAAAFHAALDQKPGATIRIFDPKVPSGQVVIPLAGYSGTAQPIPQDVLKLDWITEPILILKFTAATQDRFFGSDVIENLASLTVPDPPQSLQGAAVEVNGSGPIWLHLTLSNWLRSRDTGRIGHWDAGLKRVVWVWPLSR